MEKILEAKKDVVETYDDIDETEENLYMEFQNIVQNLSEEITEKVMASIVSTPLDEIYQKYESQHLHIERSTDKIQEVSKQFQETKEDLYKNMSGIISEVSSTVSHKVIEDTLLTELGKVKIEYERQLSSLNQSSVKLKQLNEKLTVNHKKYNKNVHDLNEKHESLQEVNTGLNKTKEELFDVIQNNKSEIETMKGDIKLLQKYSNNLKNSLNEKVDLQNKIMIGVGVVVTLSLFM